MRVLTCFLIAMVFLTVPARAQDDDDDDAGGFLVDLLQDNLSGDNRYIKVTGLDGALSGRATIQKLTVSDDDGVWLTVSDAVLDWNRLALVRGRFSVNTLSAGEIDIARKPKPTAAPVDLPTPEATPFQVPELPVEIEIGDLRVDKFVLQEPVVGRAANLSMNGALSLADGTLDAKLAIARLDRPEDELNLTAGFDNANSQITLDLKLIEANGGLVSQILSIPERPSLLLTAKGEGPVGDFTADITLASDGTERLGGQVRLFSVEAVAEDAEDAEQATPASIGFDADLSGDITPLLAQEYRAFFGSDTQLKLVGQSDPDGRLEIEKFDLLSDALILNGAFDLAGSRQIERVLLQGRIAPPEGSEVVLPIGEPRTSIQSAVISARLEALKNNTWDLSLSLDGLNRPDIKMSRAEINAEGTLDQQQSIRLDGTLNASISGLDFSDETLNRAVGSEIILDGGFETVDEAVLKLREFVMTGTDYAATVDAEIDGLDSGFRVEGRAGVEARDLSRFSGLAGRDIGGAVSATLSGIGSPLGGSFDFDLNAKAQDLKTGIEQVDALIPGATTLVLAAERNETGLEIRAFQLDGTALNAQAKGAVSSGTTNLEFSANLDDLARVLPQIPGPLSVKGDLKRTEQQTSGTVQLTAPNDSSANLQGSMSAEGAIDLKYDAALGQVERFLPEFVGTLRAQGTAKRNDGKWTIETSAKGPSGSKAEVQGTMEADGAINVDYDATLVRVERFLPEFPGTLSAKGNAQRKDDLWNITTSAKGPAQIAAEISGSINQSTMIADMTAKGQAQLGAINRFITPNSVRGIAKFDLALKGKPELNSLSGKISTAGTSMALPDVKQAISDLNADVTLANGTANVSANVGLRAGGLVRVTGPISLTSPFDTSLVASIEQLVLTDNVTFESSANGRLTYSGALAGKGAIDGEIQFGETNINIAAMSGSLGAAPIPPIIHEGQSSAAVATRARAGLIDTDSDGASPDIDLNIRLTAANKVFVRGRGLQAELGGDILIRGTVADVAPSGQIGLIRGNLDILGRRLKLSRGLVTLQGKLEPYMEFAATTSTSDGTATLEIAGPLTAPEVNVYSDPVRPSEEALAMLVFGNQYSELSPLKIAQLAASLAQLSGAGGGATDKARKGLGVDALDIGSDDSGNAQFGAGKYIAEGVYTDFTVNTLGDTELNLNLDVSDNLTLKGTVDNTGDTALGIFFERDY